MISLQDATVRYGQKVALDSVNLDFPDAQVTALIGGDGAGKSTLLKVLAKRIGKVNLGGLTSREIGYQPAQSGTWMSLSVAENLKFVSQVYQIDPAQAQSRIEAAIQTAGLVEARDRPAAKLSGGMRQKLGFMMATLHRPKLILLDEPTTGVDPVSRSELWNLIAAAAADGATVVVATTYLDEAERAHSVALMDGGKVLAAGSSSEVIAATPGHLWQAPVGKTDSASVDQYPYRWRRASTQYVWTDNHSDRPIGDSFESSSVDLENAAITRLMTEQAHVGQSFPIDFSVGAGTLVLAENVWRKYGSFAALKDVSLQTQPGQIVGLVGGNGAGKTTLMRILLGLEKPTSGLVQLFGSSPSVETRRQLGYVSQGLGLYPSLSAMENLQFAAGVHNIRDPKLVRNVAAEFEGGLVRDMPLGARRLLAFRVATLHRPSLLILDEPTSGMDPLARVRLWQELAKAAEQGVGILVTTHYMQEAEQCFQLVMLNSGVVTGEGTMKEVIGQAESVVVNTPQWRQAFHLLRQTGVTALLDGSSVRVPGVKRDRVSEILDSLDQVALREVPATLDEAISFPAVAQP